MIPKHPHTSNKSKNTSSQDEYSELNNLLLSQATGSAFPYLNGPKLKRKQYVTLLKRVFEETKSSKHTVQAERPKLVEDVQQSQKNMHRYAQRLPTTPNTKYIDRDILKRISVPKLEEEFRDVLLEMLDDVRQEFIRVTHEVGVICIIKPDSSIEGHVTLKPYQLPGKTNFHKTRLKIIKELETRLFITSPLIRGILNFCVVDLPECLINFAQYRDKTYEITELHQIFKEEIQKSKYFIRMWYQNVVTFVRMDKTPISPSLKLNYFSCGTGLISVYLSQALRSTIEHLVEVTEYKEKIPYIKMNLRYTKRILFEPSLSKLCQLYLELVEKIASIADDLPALEAPHSDEYRTKLIPIFISPEKRTLYEKQIKYNIMKLFVPILKYVEELNGEFSDLCVQQDLSSKIASVQLEEAGSEETAEKKISEQKSLVRERSSERLDVIDSMSLEAEKSTDAKKQLSFKEQPEVIKSLEQFDFEFEEELEEEEPIEQYMDLDKDITFEEGYAMVSFYKSFIDKLPIIVDVEYYMMGQLTQYSCRNAISIALRTTIDKISNKLVQQQIWENEDICEQFEMLVLRARVVPRSSDELVELSTYISWANTELLPTLKERIELSLGGISRLIEMTMLSDSHITLNSRTVHWIDDIVPILEHNSTMSEACKFELEEQMQRKVEVLQNGIKDFNPRLELLDNMDDADHTREYLNYLSGLSVVIRDFDDQLAWINKEELTFKFPLTTIPELTELKSYLYPFHRLVKVCLNWKRSYGIWVTGPLEFLDYSAAETEINEYSKELEKTQKDYRNQIRQAITEGSRMKFKGLVDDPDPTNHPAPIKLCSKTLQEIKNFIPSLNMMKIMCNDALLQRHWDEMSEIAGFDMTPNSGTTLSKLMTLGLEKDIDKYAIISIGALKERQLLENLLNMQKEWDIIHFKIGLYEDTEFKILVQLDDVQVILDDHIIKTLTMRGSAFVKPYEVKVKEWYEKILRMNAALEEWCKVQSQWLYLLPLFSSEDIVNQMPEEAGLFQEVDKVQCRYLDIIDKDSRVIQTVGTADILKDLQNSVKLLEKINEGITIYLERKRLLFPRFFFLSNIEMLEILSETKDPLRVQKHLRKCFVGVNRLKFDDKLEIHGIFSKEGEYIKFISIISTEEARGSVEKWLMQVETQMRVSIRDAIMKSLLDYESTQRSKWIQEWPGQVALIVSQIIWTSSIHYALNTEDKNTFKQLFEEQTNDLECMLNLIRSSDLSNLARITAKALITVSVHAKDVIRELMDKEVNSDKDFKWLAQLRYYWEECCVVRMINTTINYAYEYLGNTDRLVVTPLTERCYRTLMGAYQLNLNGALEGPTGTGKTETIKDLARAIAVNCLVFSCSNGLSYKVIGRLLKGIACSGAWICFNGFDRIKTESLSVVAQQITCITLALRANVAEFVFEGNELTIYPTCYICFTLNPGYPERKILPDNLKILFRPITVVIPSYVAIIEVSLYSYGFLNSKSLALKLTTLCQLCCGQIAWKNHYDLGLRAIKSILLTCDDKRRRFPDDDENSFFLECILNYILPNVLSRDVPLFKSVVEDLFPGVSVSKSLNRGYLFSAIKQSYEELEFQATDYAVSKVVETYDMMLVRHGFIVVGEPFSGKSTTLRVVSRTLAVTNEMENVQCQFINPKSLSIEQLYGLFDPTTYEWYDGVVSNCFRRFTMDCKGCRKWIIFDGPVDTTWIENLNTVLDDNKKLCLTSGETILLTDKMSTIFETIDLVQASPATISRCGVIYMEPSGLGWKSFVNSWITTCNKEWYEFNEQLILDLFDWIVPPSLSFIRKYCHQLCNPGEINLVKSMMQIIGMMLNEACNDSTKKEEDFKNMHSWIQATFLYAGLWGLGGTLNATSREKFDEFYRKLWRGQDNDHPYPDSMEKLEISLPVEGLFFDYAYVFRGRGNWKCWSEIAKVMKVEEAINIQQVLIPTVDTVKYLQLVEMHLKYKIPVLLIGPTSTGKSLCMQDVIMNKLDRELYEPTFLTFTANISANGTQELVLSKLNKQRRGHYGPPKGKLYVMFVDDLNMPIKDMYGAQPPVELLRQYLDYKMWYDFKDKSSLHLHDILLSGAMTSVRGCEQGVSPRFLRHFTIFSINEFSEESISKIYTNVLLLGFKNNGFPADVASYVQQIVAATLDVYQECITTFRPTPEKCHYVFNLKDFSRIIFGCAMLRKESADNKVMFSKIWVHEILRVIYDRLIEPKERSLLYDKVKSSLTEHFKENFDTIFGNLNEDEERDITEDELKNLMFGTYMDTESSENDKKYEEVTSVEAFYNLAMNRMREHNSTSKSKIDLVLFKYALEQLSKICRILSMPCGSALLIGLSGCGRQSLTRLAAVIAGYSLFQPKITKPYGTDEWQEDIKKVIKEAGAYGNNTVFLLSETEIKEETFLQDIDCLLKSGEVPNIFEIDEKQEILEMARLAAQGGNRNIDVSALTVLSFFIKRTREKLHIILCISPTRATLRNRFLLYPSLINCCTINWFEDWPEDALEKVAKKWLSEVTLTKDMKQLATTAFKFFHRTSKELSSEYFNKTTHKLYVTSVSYLELIKSFASLITTRQKDLMTSKSRYVAGLQKLEFAAAQIASMQKALEEYQPQLKEMSKKATEVAKEIAKETIQVENASALVRKDEVIANAQAAEAQTLKAECEADLAEAIPILEDAIAALNTLKPTDITVVKSMKNPPDAIKLVMAAVCVMKDVKPDRLPDPSTGRKILDYWGPSKRILGDMNFLQFLKDFDKDHIKPEIMVKIRKEYLPHKDFKPNVVAKASSAAEGLCKWIIAMDMYDKVAKEVAPKKEKLEKAEREYAATMAVLLEKKEEVTRLEKRLADLNVFLAEATAKQKELQDRVNLCESKLKRAEKLIDGLGGEESRWKSIADNLQAKYNSLAGDILISCGIIAYLAPFNIEWRAKVVNDWFLFVQGLQIPVSPTYDFIETLGSEVKIQSWHSAGLPQDQFSRVNAIIQNYSKRWCLLMDPELQANIWIKKMEKENGICVTKFSDDDYMTVLENCIQNGKPVLIENINEALDAAIDPILLQATFEEDENVFIELNNVTIPYDSSFRLYFTSKIRNPHFLPEIYKKVTVINFSPATTGLEELLLNIVIGKERPDLQSERRSLIAEKADNKKALADVEQRILQTLFEAKGDILEDEGAIQTLDNSKALAVEILKRQVVAKKRGEDIEIFRMNYMSVATHSAGLYSCISYLTNINLIYQYSLGWFIHLYKTSIETSKRSRELEKRLLYLEEGFTYNLYVNVCSSLFDKDKLMFSFLLCLKTMPNLILDELELSFLLNELNEKEIQEQFPENPVDKWLDAKSWNKVCKLDQITAFKGLKEHFLEHVNLWKAFYNSSECKNIEPPSPWNDKLTSFQKLLVIKSLRPHNIKAAILKFVETEMGTKYITPPPFDVAKFFEQSNCICPLVFILSTDIDPFTLVSKFAKLKGYSNRLHCISLGHDQGPTAEALVRQGQTQGSWVCLQNCHLAPSWMVTLAKLCEHLSITNTNPHFRLWLTTAPSETFPASILHHSVKVIDEPPKSLRHSLLRLYCSEPLKNMEFYKGCPGKEQLFTRMLFGIAFFHAVVKERKNFGSLGWNIPYEFNESDFNISIQQLQILITECTENLYEGIYYLITECNYGGRITDEWDRRLISTILENFLNPQLVSNMNYAFSAGGNCYRLPWKAEYDEYLEHIKSLTDFHPPELFGLHTNAMISRNLIESEELLSSISLAGGKEYCCGKSENVFLKSVAGDVISKIPRNFDLQEAENKYPLEYCEATNAALVQEMECFNKLLDEIRNSLQVLQDATEGLSILTPDLEILYNSLVSSSIPNSWAKLSYPSLKSLPCYVTDLIERFTFLQQWFKNGKPDTYWLSGFYFPQYFLFAVKQNYARKHKIPIDLLTYDFEVLGKAFTKCDDPKDGVYIYGLFLDGARWDNKKGVLAELLPRTFNDTMPLIFIKIVTLDTFDEAWRYVCPLYQTSERRRRLSTTGNSSNYVFSLLLNTDLQPSHWIKRGVALLCQID